MQVKGTVEYIRFQNPDTGWTVAELLPEGDAVEGFNLKGTLSVVGVLPGLKQGMHVSLEGSRERSKWGEQLKATSWEEVRPSDAKGIERYLASGLIKDIGPVLAAEIVKTFGTDALDIMDNNPERLMEVKGIGRKRARSIAEAVEEQREIRTVMIWMKRYDLPDSLAQRAFKKYGNNAIALIQENPYRLSDDFEGIGFKRSDYVALSVGIPKDSRMRIESGIIYVLQQATDDGCTCLPREVLVRRAASDDVLGLAEETVAETLGGLLQKEGRLVDEDGYVFLRSWWRYETMAAGRLLDLASVEGKAGKEVDILAIEKETGFNYEPEQAEAVRTALSRNVMIITGGPGTGKTVTTKAVIAALEREKKNVLLCAPTGRAAKRMSEVTGRPSSTIHRLLEYQGDFTRNHDFPLQGDALIVDESSMVDTYLLASLLDAVPDGMKVIFVGDVDQLPSVGAGNVLRDMIDSGVLPTVRLTRIFRQAQGSAIVMGAHDVNRGVVPSTDNRPGTDFWFVERADRDKVADTIRYLVETHIPQKLGYARDDIQVLTPMRKDGDPIGATCLNRTLQDALNKETLMLPFGGTEYRLGDRVMQTKNDYDKGVFNGDMGEIVCVDRDEETITVAFEGVGHVDYEKKELAHLDLAYATTVHKSQGSEYPVVVMPVHRSQYVMLNRNLLYTGITRAKKWCILVGTRDALALAVGRQDASKRYTLLRERLEGTKLFTIKEEQPEGIFEVEK